MSHDFSTGSLRFWYARGENGHRDGWQFETGTKKFERTTNMFARVERR